MIRRFAFPLALGLLFVLALSFVRAADPLPPAGDAAPEVQEFAAIRDQLVALEIENALVALNAILDRSDLPEATRVEALDLRAQAPGVYALRLVWPDGRAVTKRLVRW